MADPIAQEDLIGTLIPDVYIQGITLETNGTPIIEDEPHTISKRELESIAAFNAAAADDSMRVTVDISLKEKFDNDLIGSWFQQEEFWKFMKVKLLQTSDPYIIAILSNNQSAIDLSNTGLSPTDFGPTGFGSDDADELGLLADKLGYSPDEGGKAAALEYFKKNTATQVFSLKSIIGSDIMSQHSETVDSNGTTIHDFTLRAYFGGDQGGLKSSVSHLAYFAVSYIDFVQLEQEYNLSYDFSGTGTSIGEQNGKVASERVIENGKVVSTSFIFRTSTGEIWSGPIHRMSDGRWMTYSAHGVGSVYLTRESVPNTKVQDFRDVKEIQKLQIDLSPVENEIFVPEGQTKLLTNDRLAVPRKHFYFSDIWLSRDSDGDARFMFGWDFKNFIKRNARYGKLFDNSSSEIREKIGRLSKIHSMEIYRKRVKNITTQNQLGSPWRGEVDFDKDAEPELIAVSGEKNGGFLSTENELGSIRQSRPVLTDSARHEGFKFYTGMDKTMRSITDGEYEYGVAVYVQDGTVEYLKQRLEILSQCRHKLHQYLVEGSIPGMTKYVAEFGNPHIDSKHAQSVITSNSPGSYDPMTNRFTKFFAEKMGKKYPNVGQAPYVACVAEYVEALQLVTDALTSGGTTKQGKLTGRLNGLEMIEKLQNFISPSSGNPQGVMVMIDLYDLLISQYARLVDEDVRRPGISMSKATTPGEFNSSIVTSSPDVLMKHEHWFFNNVFDSNIEKRTGINYLYAPGTKGYERTIKEVADLASMENTDGLKRIDGGEWTQRVDYETETFWESKAADPNLSHGATIYTSSDSLSKTSMSFLSPVSWSVAGSSFVCDFNQSSDDYSLFETEILINKQSKAPYVPDFGGCSNASSEAREYMNKGTEYFSLYNLTTISSFAEPMPLMYWDTVAPRNTDTDSCAALQGEPIDPHPAWTEAPDGHVTSIWVPTSCGTEGEGTSDCGPEDSKNTNTSELLRLLFNDVDSGSPQPGNMWKNEPKIWTGVQSENLNTVEIYDLTKANKNIGAWMNSNESYTRGILNKNSYTKDKSGSHSDTLKSMPNQVKALFAGSIKPELVKLKWKDTGIDLISDVTASSTFKINYGFLMQVQMFDGFGAMKGDPQTQENLPSIKKPAWKNMTSDLYHKSVGQEILCRLNPYTLESMGIRTYEGLSTPAYDTYFFLKPQRERTVVKNFPSMLSYWLDAAKKRATTSSFYTDFISTNFIDGKK